jgi:hypothetical protein
MARITESSGGKLEFRQTRKLVRNPTGGKS